MISKKQKRIISKIVIFLISITIYYHFWNDVDESHEELIQKIVEPETKEYQKPIKASITLKRDVRDSINVTWLRIRQKFQKDSCQLYMDFEVNIKEKNINNSFSINFYHETCYDIASSSQIDVSYREEIAYFDNLVNEIRYRKEKKDILYDINFIENKITFDFLEAPVGRHSLYINIKFDSLEFLKEEYGTFDIEISFSSDDKIMALYDLIVPKDYIISSFQEVNQKFFPLSQMDSIRINEDVYFKVSLRKTTTKEVFELSYMAIKLAICVAIISIFLFIINGVINEIFEDNEKKEIEELNRKITSLKEDNQRKYKRIQKKLNSISNLIKNKR